MDQNPVVVDARFEPSEVVLQNPERPCPDEVLAALGLLDVQYLGFDGKIHQGQIVVATEVMAEVEAFFRQALELKFPIERVVPVSAPPYRWDGKKVLTDNLSSGFDYRKVQTKNKQSLHSFGLAFDINPRQNPYIRYKNGKEVLHVPGKVRHNSSKPGTLTFDHPLVKLMEGFGWQWGGNWTKKSGRIDYMHFEKPSSF
jgi:peptidoglycan LD-endopeptidase CwlK